MINRVVPGWLFRSGFREHDKIVGTFLQQLLPFPTVINDIPKPNFGIPQVEAPMSFLVVKYQGIQLDLTWIFFYAEKKQLSKIIHTSGQYIIALQKTESILIFSASINFQVVIPFMFFLRTLWIVSVEQWKDTSGKLFPLNRCKELLCVAHGSELLLGMLNERFIRCLMGLSQFSRNILHLFHVKKTEVIGPRNVERCTFLHFFILAVSFSLFMAVPLSAKIHKNLQEDGKS